MATETRTETDISGLSDSLNRVGLNENGDENRVGPDGEAAPRTDEEYAKSQLTLRAIVSSKEAGVIIGKGGKNVADLRDETGVKAGVSKVVQGVHDRVLTVNGELEGISKAYAIVAKGLLEGAPQMGMGGVISTNGTHRKSTPLLAGNVAMSDACVNAPIKAVLGFLVGKNMLTLPWDSDSSSHLPPPNGNYHRPARTENQADSGRVWCSHGRSERNATSINRADR